MSNRVAHLKRSTAAERIRWMHTRMDWNERLIEEQQREAHRKAKERGKTIDVCQEIRDTMTQQEYNEWWKAAPERNFFDYACDYLLRILQLEKPTEKE